ncbi:nitroreductase family protein [Paenibacillus radicis (ex Xue et al. 2023)]|uniref:Nitroreductase family protein n=1 Tax=Paenibacillus radicis (ex Xue et al. 2023) TaxID=2972489 RepID=A0ABT1YKY7_9BACL|nr:nitroreductase family protein [Paenibacillus radicis (ex Xue et al. 2023)]MCR8633657.1 nitroreductase family protein [Paenibacillus radicis (ex Xue et al. 2023)]
MSNETSNLTVLAPEVENNRKSDFPVSPLFLNRWSPRAYSDRKVSDEDLNTILEAAHWAPSASNDQPWRFIVAKTQEHLDLFHQFINEFNLAWASKAPVLIVVASNKLRGNGDANVAHAFDSGTAWGSLALQATILGLVTHAMGGFDRVKARQLLNVPDEFELHAVIAVGYHGDKSQLSEALQARELPNGRLPLSEVVFEGAIEK